MSSPVRLSLCGALLLGSTFHEGNAQQLSNNLAPNIGTAQQTEDASIRVEATKVEGERRLQIELRNGDVFEVIGKIAGVGNLQVVVKGEARVAPLTLSIENVSPEVALQKVCEVAKLSYQVKDGVWILTATRVPIADTDEFRLINSLTFTNVEITEVLSAIATQCDVPIAISGDVTGKFRLLRLQNKTPSQALDIIALAANLKIQRMEDGIIIVSKEVTLSAPTFDIPGYFRKRTPVTQPKQQLP